MHFEENFSIIHDKLHGEEHNTHEKTRDSVTYTTRYIVIIR